MPTNLAIDDRLIEDHLGCGKVLFEEQRRHRQHIADVSQAVTAARQQIRLRRSIDQRVDILGELMQHFGGLQDDLRPRVRHEYPMAKEVAEPAATREITVGFQAMLLRHACLVPVHRERIPIIRP